MRVCSLCHRCYDDSDLCCTEEGHPLSDTRSGSPEMIAGYRLDFLLGSGVKGDIYRAHQTAFGRSCLIAIHLTDAQTAQKFLDEAKLAAALFHPNVADVYEAGMLETGECFVVAEDPEDETLRDRLQTAGVPKLLNTIEIVRQTAEALHALHLKGLTHRALRPENIILTTDVENQPLVKIQNIDFAGVTERSIISNKFLIDSAIDSLRYFAPEQCSGESVGIKADVYSLGIVLYEMLAGTPPFDATTAAGLIDKHRNHRPPDIRIDNFELRMLITHTLMESLHKRPDKRQSSANAFARQLRHIEQLATHVSTPPPAGTVRIPPKDANRIDVAAAIATVTEPPTRIETPKVIIAASRQPDAESPEPFATVERPSPTDLSHDTTAEAVHPVHSVHSLHSVHHGQFDNNAEPKAPAQSTVENFGTTIANFVRERSAPAISHFSRLKQRRKKPHPKIEPPAKAEPEANPQPEPEPTESARKPATFSAEAAAIRLEQELNAVKELRSRKQPKKIEFVVSEDDIPAIKEENSVPETEEIIEIPVIQETWNTRPVKETAESPAAVEKQSSKIEWIQPEDCIPSLADVHEAVRQEHAEAPIVQQAKEVVVAVFEIPETTVTAEPAPEPFTIETVAIKAETPAVTEVLKAAEQQTPQPAAQKVSTSDTPDPVVETQPELPAVVVARPNVEAPAVAVRQPEKPITRPEMETAKPAVQTPKKAPAPIVDPNFAPAFQLKPRGIRVSGLQAKKAPVATLEDLEEITLVSPPRSRFRVPVNKPQPARKHTPARRVVPIPSNEAVFIPTLLGGAVKPATIEPAPADSILAAYYPTPSTRSIHRYLAAGTGFLALISFFLFASDSVWNTSTATSGETVSAKSASTKETLPATAPASLTLPIKKNPFKAADKPATNDAAAALERISTTTERPAAVKNAAKPLTPNPVRAAVPETVKPITKREPEKRIVEKRPEPITVRSNGATRPRVVPES